MDVLRFRREDMRVRVVEYGVAGVVMKGEAEPVT